jgi:hypothetical protein
LLGAPHRQGDRKHEIVVILLTPTLKTLVTGVNVLLVLVKVLKATSRGAAPIEESSFLPEMMPQARRPSMRTRTRLAILRRACAKYMPRRQVNLWVRLLDRQHFGRGHPEDPRLKDDGSAAGLLHRPGFG